MQLRRNLFPWAVFAELAAGVWAAGNNTADFPYIPLDQAAIRNQDRVPDDPISRLQARLDAGAAHLNFDPN